MQKISLTIDLNKIDTTKVKNRTYTKDGQEVQVKEYKLEVVSLKQKKMIKQGDSWVMFKTHFVCDSQTKEERENKKETNYLGDGITFESKASDELENLNMSSEDTISPEDLPF